MNRLLSVLFLAVGFNLANCSAQAKGDDITVQKGSQVSFNYVLTVDGAVVDTSESREPFTYTHGDGNIIPGLSKHLEGLRVGDEKKIEIPPEEAYGLVNPKAFQEVSKLKLPPDMEPKVGMPLEVRSPEGGAMPVKIAEVKKDTVVIDFNHPLAGKTLTFQVKVVSIK